ncbi:TIGR03943 family protein [Streptomyces sp. MK5]|uniref:TIGR03943 family putative permease subunit n=1 Tax=Streptomyces sp. MK5 TaxID=3064253 RepID=UPI0027421AF9|nr:TIGR03943 family protein [Streptomyces sp. MK5]
MNRQAQAAVLFLTGVVLLHAGFTGLYLRYVKAGLQPLLLLSGAVLIAAAAATVWYEWRGGTKHGGDGHAHVHREPRVSWLLLLPLFALVLLAPPALGSYSAVRTGTALQKPYGYENLPTSDPLRLSVVDYADRAVYDHGRFLSGRRLKITGFVALAGDGTPYLVRMALNCCAADAQPVKIALTGRVPPVLRPDAWLEVTGTYTPRRTTDPVNNGPIPYLYITAAKPVPTPRDPYDETWNQ